MITCKVLVVLGWNSILRILGPEVEHWLPLGGCLVVSRQAILGVYRQRPADFDP